MTYILVNIFVPWILKTNYYFIHFSDRKPDNTFTLYDNLTDINNSEQFEKATESEITRKNGVPTETLFPDLNISIFDRNISFRYFLDGIGWVI